MKKFTFLLLTVLSLICFTSCGNSKTNSDSKLSSDDYEFISALQSEVEDLNAACPSDMGDGMTMSSVKLEDKYVIYSIQVNETEDFNVANMKGNKQMLKSELMRELVDDPDPDIQEYCKACANAGIGIKYRYTGLQSGDICEVTIESDQLKK